MLGQGAAQGFSAMELSIGTWQTIRLLHFPFAFKVQVFQKHSDDIRIAVIRRVPLKTAPLVLQAHPIINIVTACFAL
jgi:hypothetical protein